VLLRYAARVIGVLAAVILLAAPAAPAPVAPLDSTAPLDATAPATQDAPSTKGAPAKKRPPANLIVPESIKRERAPPPEEDPAVDLGLGSPEVLAAAGPLRAVPGSWAEYLVQKNGEAEVRLRLSVLPPPAGAPEGSYWLEITAVGSATYPTAIKLLVHGDPLKREDLDRVLLYPAGQAPLELPLDDARDELPKPIPVAHPARIKKLGLVDIKVVAGSFHAERLRVLARGGKTQLWLSREQVPLWGLVRSEGAGRTVELLDYGKTGAHSVVPAGPGEIDERPDGG
jgi:hypothetical protein